MADPDGPDGPPEEDDDAEQEGEFQEEEDDEDTPFLRADHPAYQRIQNVLAQQLKRSNDRVTLELREKNEELRKLVKHREEIGVTLYTAQQQLAKLQLQLEQLHDKFAMVHSKHQEEEEGLKQTQVDYDHKKGDVAEMQKRVAKSQDELNQLNITVRQVQEYNEQMKAEIQNTRRATYKAEDQIKNTEKVKMKQDVLIDNMNEEVKRMTEQKALLEAQLVAQKQETEAATQTLREAAKEMEAIEFEKKQLMGQWKSSLLHTQRRDDALKNVMKALSDLAEQELAVENEIRGLHTSIRQEQERNEQLSSLKERNDTEMKYLQSGMTSIKQERERLMDNFNMIKRSMDVAIEETNKVKLEMKENSQQMTVVERHMETVSRDVKKLAGKIDEHTSEQTTCERVEANSKKRIKKIQEEIAQKETEGQNLYNEIARVKVDSLNTKAHNQMLKERQKQLAEELSEREKLIEQYEQEIRKRHHQIEKKQLYVDRLNREYDDKRTKLEAEAGEADILGPQEAKLKHMKKQIADITKDCADMQKDWLQKQTQLLQISTESDRLKASVADQKNRKIVLEQKRIRIEGQLEAQKKEIKELDNAMKHLRFDMDRMNTLVVKNESKSQQLANANQMMETEFVQKLKEKERSCLEMERSIERIREEKAQMSAEVLEAERQALLWERKITLEKEMQEALDPNTGMNEAAAMKKEIHRMELRLEQLKRKQEQMIVEMERAINKRDAIALKYEPKAKKGKQAQSNQNMKRQIQSLKNNLRLCTQAKVDAESKIQAKEQELGQLQQTIEQTQEQYGQLEAAAEELRSEIQVGNVAKQRNLSAILRMQRTAKRCDELCQGTGPPPASNVRAQYNEQLAVKNKVVDVVKVLHDTYPQLELLWSEFYAWLDVGQN